VNENKNIIEVKDEEPIELDERVGTPLTNPVYCFQEISNIFEGDDLDNIENLKTGSIKKKLSNFDDNLFEMAGDHLKVIESVEYFYNIINQVEAVINNNIWGIDDDMNVKECTVNLEFIRKIIRMPLNDIKDYWKEYDKEQEEIQKQKLEKIDNLTLAQFSELCLTILKKAIGGSVEKSNKEYLVELIDNYDVEIPK